MTGCNRHDTKLQSAIIGSWSEGGAHTLTFESNGHYSSVYPSPTSQSYEGSWHIYRGLLVMTTRTSNSVPFSSIESSKVLLDGDRLILKFGTNQISHDRLK